MLSLGAFPENDFARDERLALIEPLKAIYQAEADPGLHAASEWLLRRWKQESWLNQQNEIWARDREGRDECLHAVRAGLTKGEGGRTRPRWYVNGQGQTMIVIPGPREFLMGSPDHEVDRQPQETLHLRRIDRSYAIGAKPVTLNEFLRFRPDHKYSPRFAPSQECPANYVDWFSAIAYCNWLSQQEGIPESQWCYETNAAGEPIKLKEKFLSLTGYRLPTEAEWEFACRAGATAARFYGESLKLLDEYAWAYSNAQDTTWPVALRKPNDLGLFDVYGNVWQWCQDVRKSYVTDPTGRAVVDNADDERVLDEQNRHAVRGGSFYGVSFYTRSASRLFLTTDHGTNNVGLRVARTLR
jgi:formylglycine-generating enzyme required for sulfatase activity